MGVGRVAEVQIVLRAHSLWTAGPPRGGPLRRGAPRENDINLGKFRMAGVEIVRRNAKFAIDVSYDRGSTFGPIYEASFLTDGAAQGRRQRYPLRPQGMFYSNSDLL